MRYFILCISIPLQAMEEAPLHFTDVPIHIAVDEARAERIIDIYFNGNGEKLKSQIVPRLSQKLKESREEFVLAKLNSTLVICPERARSPSTEEIFNFAEKMLALSLHEVIEEKTLELKSSERKKKCVTVVAICEAVGIVGASLAAILVAVYH